MTLDLKAIEERAAKVPPIGYLVTAFGHSWDDDPLDDTSLAIAKLAREDIPALVARVKELEAALQDIEPRLIDVREFVADFDAIGDTEESCQRIALKDIGWIRQRIWVALNSIESDTPV